MAEAAHPHHGPKIQWGTTLAQAGAIVIPLLLAGMSFFGDMRAGMARIEGQLGTVDQRFEALENRLERDELMLEKRLDQIEERMRHVENSMAALADE